MKITNTQPGPRGINTVNGPALIDPGQTIETKVFAREREHIEAAGWFMVDGDYEGNPGEIVSETLKLDGGDKARIAELEASITEKDAEIEGLKKQLDADDDKTPGREELKAQAKELGIEFARNATNEKLKELIDAKLAA